MYCKHCLAANPAEAVKCIQCGAALADAMAGSPPSAAAAMPELDLQDDAPAAGHATGPVAPSGGAAIGGNVGAPIGGPPPKPGEEDKPEVEAPPMPPDHKTWGIGVLVGSVLSMPCSCFTLCSGCGTVVGLILGLMSLLESGKVKTLYEDKNYELAEAASKRAKLYAMIGIASLVLLGIAAIALRVLFTGFSFFNQVGNRGQGY